MEPRVLGTGAAHLQRYAISLRVIEPCPYTAYAPCVNMRCLEVEAELKIGKTLPATIFKGFVDRACPPVGRDDAVVPIIAYDIK